MSSYFEPDNPNILIGANKVISGTTSVPFPRPPFAAVALTAPGGVNAYNALPADTIVAANVLTSHMLIGLLAYAGNAGAQEYTIQVYTGAANAEVGIGQWPFFINQVGLYSFIPVVPAITIPANARVSAQIASTVAGNTLNLRLLFIPRPIA